jgi:alanine racemase
MQTLGPIWTEIDMDTIVENVQSIRRSLGSNVMIMGVVKANAYGHDAPEIAPLLIQNGVSYLGVARLAEGIELRKSNIKAPILILGLTIKEDMEALLAYNITSAVCDIGDVEFLSKLAVKNNKVAKVHVKVDTGLGRIGVSTENAMSFIRQIKDMKNIQIEGIFTHFAVADEQDKSFTEEQFGKFSSLLETIERAGIRIPLKHVANTATVLDLPHMSLDMVRLGVLLFGLYPSVEVQRTIEVKSALKFKSRIIYLKQVPTGRSISYGRTYTTTANTLVATLPVGYADGYSRLLSNSAAVVVKGKKAPVIGRVCMDQTMIDVTHIPGIEVGDEVTLWSGQEIYESAERMHTIVNEVVCMADKKRVPKLFIRNGRPYKVKSMLGEMLL